MSQPKTPGRGESPAVVDSQQPRPGRDPLAEGEPLWKIDTCESCHRPVIWAVTVRAKSMPVDAEPPLSGGNVALEWRGKTVHPLAHVLGVAAQFGRTNLRTSHFVTCPQAGQWRRRKAASRG